MSIRSELKEVIRERLGLIKEVSRELSADRVVNSIRMRRRRMHSNRITPVDFRRLWDLDPSEYETSTERGRRLMQTYSQPKEAGRKKR